MSSEVQTVIKKVKKLPGTIVKPVEESSIVNLEVPEENWTIEDESKLNKLFSQFIPSEKKKSKIDLSISALHDIHSQLQGTEFGIIEIDELYEILKNFKTTEELDLFFMKVWKFHS